MINKVWNEAKKFIYILDRQQKMWGCVVFFLSFIGALAETLGVSVILPLVQVMIDPDALFENKYIHIRVW